ncbi:MAG: shikimate dehydrogenase [Acutalibacteraceae bacterium]|nr:shikimate dehydrogenase [Acutalibacteraceae bacterium]
MSKKFGVIGYPIGHTMSPFIQKELFALRGITAEYDKYQIEPEKLPEEFNRTLKGLDGFNITIPHKIAIMGCCDVIDGSAAEYGAVNTVCRRDGRYYGFNTDSYGFLKGLEFSDIPLDGKVLIYGFGGAARTLITESLKAGCEVTVGTTAELKAAAEPVVAELAAKNGKKIHILTNDEIDKEFDLLVNATPVGMYPKIGVSPLTATQVELFKYVYDIVYNPSETELLKTAKEKGKVCGGGLSMLVCQAMKSQTHWLGVEFTKEETALVIEKSAKELSEVFK